MQLHKGMKVRCKIKSSEVEAEVQSEGREFYLCQNTVSGEYCSNKLGYRYSWFVGRGDDEDLKRNSITDLKILSLTLDDLYCGCVVGNKYYKRKVLARIEDLVFLSSTNDFEAYSTVHTITALKENGYVLISPEPEVEENMIEIKGKKYSEDTIHKALKGYVG